MAYTFPDEEMGISLRQTRGRAGRQVHDPARSLKGRAEMVRKVYEIDPMVCPQCGGRMKVVAFLAEQAVVDRIIDHLKLAFKGERHPPPEMAAQELIMAADYSTAYSP